MIGGGGILGGSPMSGMRRREFVALLDDAAAWPVAAHAPAMPVIGYLSSGSSAAFAPMVAALRRGLNEAGAIEGQSFVPEFRWAEGRYDRLPAFANDFVRRPVAVIVATGGSDPALAAKTATRTTPIVFTGGLDPVQLGLVASLARPGGNAIGTINSAPDLNAKRLAFLRQLVPTAKVMAVLANRSVSDNEVQLKEVQVAAAGQQTLLALADEVIE
jgi:putative tryptophan/tyrosine transport system substrate-binding protein